jgi:DNA-binding CsgD family transcriptional regulator
MEYSNLLLLSSLILCLSLAVGGTMVVFRIEYSRRIHAHQYLQFSLAFLYIFGFYSLWGNILLRSSADTDGTDIGSTVISQMGAPFLLLGLLLLLIWSAIVIGSHVRAIAAVAIAVTSGLVLLFIQSGWNVADTVRATNSIVGFCIPAIVFLGFTLWKSKLVTLESRNLILSLCACSGLIHLSYFTSLVHHPLYETLFVFFFFLFNTVLAIEFAYATNQEKTRSFDDFIQNFKISKREADVIGGIYEGKTNQEIASKLFISLQTVKDHTSRIYQKVQVKNRNQLTAILRDSA